MSVLVTIKAAADTEQFRRFTETDGDLMVKIANDGKAQGAIHHRFGIGDGFVFVSDEWADAESFQRFFASEDIATAMQRGGIQGEPEVTIVEAIETPDQF